MHLRNETKQFFVRMIPSGRDRKADRSSGNRFPPMATERLEERLALAAALPSPPAWAVTAGGRAVGSSVAAFNDGSTVVTGYYSGTTQFGSTELTNGGNPNLIVSKLKPNGSYEWTAEASGWAGNSGTSVAVLADGASIVTGSFLGTAVFGSTTLTSSGLSDIFIAKVNSDGSFAWATRAGGSRDDRGCGVSVLPDGSSIVTGSFIGAAEFGSATLSTAGSYWTFVAKLNPYGSFVWATWAGGSGDSAGAAVSTLADGSSIVTGSFSHAAKFGSATLWSLGQSDVFVAKLNPDGSYAWAKRAGGVGQDVACGAAALADGSTLVTGSFEGSASFDDFGLTSAGGGDIFVAKWESSGSLAWVSRAGGTGDDTSDGISTLADGSSIITGYFVGAADFGSTKLTASPYGDIFVAKLNPTGSHAWATRAGGTSEKLNSGIKSFGVSTVTDGSAVITGSFTGAATFGGTVLGRAEGQNGPNLFVAKTTFTGSFDFVPPPPTDVIATFGNAQAALVWEPPVPSGCSAISGYAIRYSADNGGTWATVPTLSMTTATTVTGLANGSSYVFQVAAVNAAGASDYSVSSAAVVPMTVPDAPMNLVGVSGDRQVVLNWTAPLSNGGSAISDYVVEFKRVVDPTWLTFSREPSTATAATVSGLLNGTKYDFRVRAANNVGTGAPFGLTVTVIPRPTVPGNPTGVAGTPTSRGAILSWAAPPSNGGATISNYRVDVSSDRGRTWTTVTRPTSPATSARVTGLVNGRAYVFRVLAINAIGTGSPSATSADVTPRTVPDVPRRLVGVASDGSANLTWATPPTNGGSAITNYRIDVSSDRGRTWTTVTRLTSPATSATLTGLVNGRAYVFRVLAVNAAGTGAASATSAVVRPRTIPGVPIGLRGIARNGSANLTWATPPTNGGAAITNYRIDFSDDLEQTWTTFARPASAATSARVTGLVNGRAYVFRVLAVNAAGTGAASATSAVVTPSRLP